MPPQTATVAHTLGSTLAIHATVLIWLSLSSTALFSSHTLPTFPPLQNGRVVPVSKRPINGELPWHQTLKNRALFVNYFLPGDLEDQIKAFMDPYSHQHYRESLTNVTLSDVYFGRDTAILNQRERSKQNTLQARRCQHRKQTALSIQSDEPRYSLHLKSYWV